MIPKIDQSKQIYLLELNRVAEILKGADYYLLGIPITLLTDSKVVSFYNKSVSCTSKIERVLTRISEYDLDLEYIRIEQNKSTPLCRYVNMPGKYSDGDKNILKRDHEIHTQPENLLSQNKSSLNIAQNDHNHCTTPTGTLLCTTSTQKQFLEVSPKLPDPS